MERNPEELLSLATHMRGRMCYILIMGLKDPDLIVRRKHIKVSCDRLLIKMGKMGLLISIKPGVWKINLEYLRKVSYIVTDELFDKISDPEVMFQYKKKKGMYKNSATHEEQKEKWRKKDRQAKEARNMHKANIKEKEFTDDMFAIENILFPNSSDKNDQ